MSRGTAALPERVEVVVVGGGVIGASVAFHLAEDGVDVLLVEGRELGSGSSGKPIGGVRAQFSDPLNVDLGRRSLELYEDFARRPGRRVGLRQPGYLFLLPTPDDVALFERSVAMQNARGVDSRMVSLAEARRLNPYVNPAAYAGAVFGPRDGWAHPGEVVAGYVEAAEMLGALVRTHAPVTAVEPRGDGTHTVVTARGTVVATAVVVCAGAWSRAVGELVGVGLPVEPVRRQIAFTTALDPAPPSLPFTIDFGSTFYVHNADNPWSLLLGVAEPGTPAGFDTAYDPAWEPYLRQVTARCTPALADVPLASGWAGLYEMTPDHNALIGEARGLPARVLYACGFSGHGFLQAPAVGEAVRDLYAGRAPAVAGSVDVTAFGAERFTTSWSRTEANII